MIPAPDTAFIAAQMSRLATMPADALAIGYTMGSTLKRPFGFAQPVVEPRVEVCGTTQDGALANLLLDRSEGHVMTIAPTGAGKGVNVVIPTLLCWQGQSLTIDPKGEAFRVAGPHLHRRGYKVIAIDLHGDVEAITVDRQRIEMGRINPVATLDPRSPTFAADTHSFALTLTGPSQSLSDRFWDNNGIDLTTGALGLLCVDGPVEQRNLFGLRDLLTDPQLDHRFAVALDTGRVESGSFIERAICNFLGHEGEKVRSSVRSTAAQYFTGIAGDHLRKVISSTSFDFADIVTGEKLAIFLIVPPHCIEASSMLLRVIVSTILGLITRRKVAPPLPTLMILDELAQLGSFPLLRPLVTLMRGYGVRAMLMLQDASQLRQLYPQDYSTIVNNCSILSTFGHGSYAMSRELAELFGDISADELFGLKPTEMAVRLNGQRTQVARRLNYLTDPLFAGLFAANPMARVRHDAVGPLL